MKELGVFMKNEIVIVRGGGDIATGTIQKLHRVGYRVLVLETKKPTVIRRTVAVATCIYTGEYKLEDITVVKCEDEEDIYLAWENNKIPVIVDPLGKSVDIFKPNYIVDGILAKKNLGFTNMNAPVKIALGPGFEAGVDADIVIETNRGHNLGRLLFTGFPEENTGSPGVIAGVSLDRVIYSEYSGIIEHRRNIGDIVEADETIAVIEGKEVKSKIKGILRGLIENGFEVEKGLKIADVDPREGELENCYTISDKARAIGGNVLEAILIMKNRKGL